jgi:hypothetical protein
MALLFLSGGCGGGEVERMRSELVEARKEIHALSVENERLIAQCKALEGAVAEVKASHDHLKHREAQLAQWARQLADRFGPGVWYFGPDEKPLPHRSVDRATPMKLVALLNALFKNENLPAVILVGIENGVARVRIEDEEQLTQNMGSAGATSYLLAVTFTLCSLPDIGAVDFDFKGGDHAVPGRYSR